MAGVGRRQVVFSPSSDIPPSFVRISGPHTADTGATCQQPMVRCPMPDFPTSLLYVDGKLRPAEGGRTFDVESPVNAKIVGQAADATASDVDEALAAARRAFDDTAWPTNLPRRIEALRRWQKAMQDSANAWRDRIMAESGCTRLMSHMLHLDKPVEMIGWTIGMVEQFEWQRDLGVDSTLGMPSRRLVLKEAAGVVGAITPWNVPMQIN